MSKEKDIITQTTVTEDTISLFLDDGVEIECDILAIFPVKEHSMLP